MQRSEITEALRNEPSGRLRSSTCLYHRIPRLDFSQYIRERIFRPRSVAIQLQANPEPLGRAEKLRQAQARVCRHRARTRNDFADATLRHADLFGQTVLCNGHRFQKFFEENFTGGWVRNFAHLEFPSVVVDDFNVFRAAVCTHEAHAPLLVDADAVLTFAVAR